jgi:hypothetical protein
LIVEHAVLLSHHQHPGEGSVIRPAIYFTVCSIGAHEPTFASGLTLLNLTSIIKKSWNVSRRMFDGFPNVCGILRTLDTAIKDLYPAYKDVN